MGRDRLDSLAAYLNECKQWNCRLMGCLIDAQVTGVYGGSGKTVPWARLSREYQSDAWPPMILAGGLHPQNVAEAIAVIVAMPRIEAELAAVTRAMADELDEAGFARQQSLRKLKADLAARAAELAQPQDD